MQRPTTHKICIAGLRRHCICDLNMPGIENPLRAMALPSLWYICLLSGQPFIFVRIGVCVVPDCRSIYWHFNKAMRINYTKYCTYYVGIVCACAKCSEREWRITLIVCVDPVCAWATFDAHLFCLHLTLSPISCSGFDFCVLFWPRLGAQHLCEFVHGLLYSLHFGGAAAPRENRIQKNKNIASTTKIWRENWFCVDASIKMHKKVKRIGKLLRTRKRTSKFVKMAHHNAYRDDAMQCSARTFE